jgi:hypothetical protein
MDQLRVLEAAFDFAPSSGNYHAPFNDVEHPMLDFLGIRFVISNEYAEAKERLIEVARYPERAAMLFENPDALPRFFIPKAVAAVDSEELSTWLTGLQDGAVVAIPTESLRLQAEISDVPQPPAVAVTHSKSGRIRLTLPSAPATQLVASSIPGPTGWRAEDSQGRALDTAPVNGAFLGVIVPPGVGEVVLHHSPPGLRLGLALAVAGALVAPVLLLSTTLAPHHRTPTRGTS